jgi:hypothetical protein
MDTFLLVYLISTIAEADGLDWTKGPACLAAYAPVIDIVDLCSFRSYAAFTRPGFGCFTRSH